MPATSDAAAADADEQEQAKQAERFAAGLGPLDVPMSCSGLGNDVNRVKVRCITEEEFGPLYAKAGTKAKRRAVMNRLVHKSIEEMGFRLVRERQVGEGGSADVGPKPKWVEMTNRERRQILRSRLAYFIKKKGDGDDDDDDDGDDGDDEPPQVAMQPKRTKSAPCTKTVPPTVPPPPPSPRAIVARLMALEATVARHQQDGDATTETAAAAAARKITELEATIAQLQADADAARQQNAQLQADADAAHRQNEAVVAQLHEAYGAEVTNWKKRHADLEKQVALKKQKKEQIKTEPDAVTSIGDTAAGDSSGLDRVESSVSTTPQVPEDVQSQMYL